MHPERDRPGGLRVQSDFPQIVSPRELLAQLDGLLTGGDDVVSHDPPGARSYVELVPERLVRQEVERLHRCAGDAVVDQPVARELRGTGGDKPDAGGRQARGAAAHAELDAIRNVGLVAVSGLHGGGESERGHLSDGDRLELRGRADGGRVQVARCQDRQDAGDSVGPGADQRDRDGPGRCVGSPGPSDLLGESPVGRDAVEGDDDLGGRFHSQRRGEVYPQLAPLGTVGDAILEPLSLSADGQRIERPSQVLGR